MYKNGEVHNVSGLSDYAVPCKIVGVAVWGLDGQSASVYVVKPLEKIETWDCYITMKCNISPSKMRQCQYCGKYIEEDKGVTCHNGEWVCDDDSCSVCDRKGEKYMKSLWEIKM